MPERASRTVSSRALWAGAIALGVLAGALGGTLGPSSVAGVAALAVAMLGVVRWPGLVFAAYLLLPFYKGFANPFVPVDLTVALAALNGLQVIWILRGDGGDCVGSR